MRQHRPGKLSLSTSAVIVLGGVGVIGAGWAVGALDGGWVGAFLRSRATTVGGGLVLGTALALYVLAGAMWRLGRARPPQRRQAGTAAIEFALVFPFALMIVLIMIQSMLVVAGNLAVHYAAYAAARAAVVWVPEKLSYEEPRNIVALDPDGSAKFHRIRCAAVYALLPVSAGKPGAGGTAISGGAATVREGMTRFFELYGADVPNWIRSMLEAKFQYAWDYTEVVLFPPAEEPAYGDHEDLRVRVRHRLYLPVPYANRIFGSALPDGAGDYGTSVEATYALTNHGVEDEIDVEQFPRTVGKDEW